MSTVTRPGPATVPAPIRRQRRRRVGALPTRGWLYPAVMFALWHVSPTCVRGSAARSLAAAGGLGLLYGWVAYRTVTVRYTIPAHFLVYAMGLQFALLLGR